MKYLLILMMLFAVNSYANEKGNGGFGLKCNNKVEILDLYEAREVHRLNVDLGPPEVSVESKIDIMLTRLEKWMPKQAAEFKDLANNFFPDSAEILGGRIVIVANKEVLREGKRPPLDIGNTIIPRDCDIVAMARNFDEESSPTRKERAFIIEGSWKRADNNTRAALILHELFFMSGYKLLSQDIRYTVAYLASAEFTGLNFREWIDISKDVLNIEFNGIEFQRFGNFDYDAVGMPLRVDGIYRLDSTVRTAFVNGISIKIQPDSYVYDGKYLDLLFSSEYKALGGYLIPEVTTYQGSKIRKNIKLSLLGGFIDAELNFDNLDEKIISDLYINMDQNSLLEKAFVSAGSKIIIKADDQQSISALKAILINKADEKIELIKPEEKLNEIIGGPSAMEVHSIVLNKYGKVLEAKIYSNGSHDFLPNIYLYRGGLKSWRALPNDKYELAIESMHIRDDLNFYYRDRKNRITSSMTIKIEKIIVKKAGTKACITTFASSSYSDSHRENYKDIKLITKLGKRILIKKRTKLTFTIDKEGIPLGIGCNL